MKWTFGCLVIVLIQTIFVQTAQAAVSVDTAAKSIENTQIKIMYAPGNSVEEGLTMHGLSTVQSKTHNENYASTMDAIGNGFASYSLESVTSYTVKESTAQYATVNVKRTNNVDIEENLRVYDHLPLLEIEYVKFNNALWFEDFYTKVAEPRVYSIYGIPTEVDGAKQQQWETAADQAAGHNYGDAFLAAAGCTSYMACTYNGYLIFGIYNTTTKRGLGFVMPGAKLGQKDGWKLWSMYNYESFPNFGSPSITYPWKRYVFLLTEGREQLFTVGKWVADHDAAKQPLTDGNPYGGTDPTSDPTATPPPSGCTKKALGDADCNGNISVTDYAVWRTEYKGGCSSTNLTAAACGDNKDNIGTIMDADFGGDNKVSLADYQVWRSNI